MSDSSTGETGRELVRGERGRFQAGAPSANPRGRPPRGQSIAEQWRRDVNWEQKRERLEQIAADPKAKHSDVIAAIVVLLDRAWGRPVSALDVSVSKGADANGASELGALPVEDRREILELVRAKLQTVRALPDATNTDGQPLLGQSDGYVNRVSPTTSQAGTHEPGHRHA